MFIPVFKHKDGRYAFFLLKRLKKKKSFLRESDPLFISPGRALLWDVGGPSGMRLQQQPSHGPARRQRGPLQAVLATRSRQPMENHFLVKAAS